MTSSTRCSDELSPIGLLSKILTASLLLNVATTLPSLTFSGGNSEEDFSFNGLSFVIDTNECQSYLTGDPRRRTILSPPIIIDHGGEYTGNWMSPANTTAAVTIRTIEPVTIIDSTLVGYGDLIAAGENTNVFVKESRGLGLGASPGKFIAVRNPNKIELKANYLQDVWGIRIDGAGPGVISGKFALERNVGCNMKGSTKDYAHFLLVADGVFRDSKAVMNYIVNEPFKSRVEDVINFYNARGISGNSIQVAGNTIVGAYPDNPVTDSFSGGGIITDGGGKVGEASASAYIEIASNCIVSTTNYGIGIAYGNNIVVDSNLVLSSGSLMGGSRKVKAQNVGVYVWDIGKTGPAAFFHNTVRRNRIFWRKPGGRDGLQATMNNAWFPDCGVPESYCKSNQYGDYLMTDEEASHSEDQVVKSAPNCATMTKLASDLFFKARK